MTMKVQEQVISVNRKNHPNAVRYPCRATHEILEAGRKFLTSLSQQQRDLLLQSDLILDEEETGELFDAFKENDIIGLAILRNDGFHSNTYRIEKIHKGEDWLECENAYSKESEVISFQDVSVGMALGFAEILYRDDKPFGINDTYDLTIRYEVEEEEEEKKSPQNEGTDNEGSSLNGGNLDENKEMLLEEVKSESTEKSESSSLVEKKSNLDFCHTYFAFGFDNDSMSQYVIITPAKLWDETQTICDSGSADHLAAKLGITPLMESTYEYDSVYSESQLRQILNAFRASEKPEMVI